MTVSWPGNMSLTNGDADPVEGIYAVAMTDLGENEFNAELLSLVGYSDKDKFQLGAHRENRISTPVKLITPQNTYFQVVVRVDSTGSLKVENSGKGIFKPLRPDDFIVSPCLCKGTLESNGKKGGHMVKGCFEVHPATTIMREITISIPDDDGPLSLMIEEVTGQITSSE